ncbi:hypothetical protein AVEN_3840-1 [Araneus ventricosus]|uniref:Transposase Tc1-like domain-containing protein n=1 Tax=Araneus ventricosus TaxID=182803 RepID=A0A4Y2GPX6_ARAVE|nr:hypothetical protein AVEN_3840-1 [Araneus ventricosus]
MKIESIIWKHSKTVCIVVFGYLLLVKEMWDDRIPQKQERSRQKTEACTRENSIIERLATKKNDISSREIMKYLKFNVSALTVCRRIKYSGLMSAIFKETTHTSKKATAVLLAFAKEHLWKNSQF